MNIFNEAIYKNHLEHSAKGQTWGKHKYIAIKNGRYIYPEDVNKSGGLSSIQQREKNVVSGGKGVAKGPSVSAAKKQEDQIRAAHQGSVSTGSNNKTASPTIDRNKQIADQIKSAHSVAANRKMSVVPQKKEEPKTEASTTAPAATETKDDKTKSSGKSGGKKGGGSKKSSKAKKSTAKTKANAASVSATNASEEAKSLGLTDDDLKILDSNIDSTATDRDTVITNLALRVIKGDFGNGADRRKKLGKYYNDIQKKVNEITKSIGPNINKANQNGTAASNSTNTKESSSSSNASTATTSTGSAQTNKDTKSYSRISSNESRVANSLSTMTGMKTSYCQQLVKLYQKDVHSDEFRDLLDGLAEGDDKQKEKNA